MKTKKRILTHTHYTYLQPHNAVRVRKKASEWGSSSNYLNYLVAKDHDDKKSIRASRELQQFNLTPPPARKHADKVASAARNKAKKGKKKASGKKKKATASKARKKRGGGKLLKVKSLKLKRATRSSVKTGARVKSKAMKRRKATTRSRQAEART
jgi:hypothetical protein